MTTQTTDTTDTTAVDLFIAVQAATRWLNASNGTDRAEQTLRILKVTEETGEAAAAWIGHTGQNPRKGVTHSTGQVAAELADVAFTALVAITSLGHDPATVLADTVAKVLARAAEHCDLCGAPADTTDMYPVPGADGTVIWVCTDMRDCDDRCAHQRWALT